MEKSDPKNIVFSFYNENKISEDEMHQLFYNTLKNYLINNKKVFKIFAIEEPITDIQFIVYPLN